MKKLILLLSAIIALSLMPVISFADDLEAADEAYEKGDYQTALKIFKPLADKGDTRAQFSLGVMYAQGKGVKKNYTEAVKYYRLAAQQGNAGAQSNLGYMYEQGNGVLQNYNEAIKYYRLSAQQGNAGGQFSLGDMYLYGKGVRKNNILAHMWLNIAAANGSGVGKSLRDFINTKMTQAEITKAQKLAQQCLESNYKNCAE